MIDIDYGVLLPALLPLAGVVLVILADLVVPRLRQVPYAVALLASLGAAGATIPGVVQADGEVRTTLCPGVDGSPSGALPAVEGVPQTCLWTAGVLGSGLQLVACLAAAACIALAWPVARARLTGGQTERSTARSTTREPIEAVLLLTALAGTVVVAAARDVGTWLVALELATLPVVVLVALSGTRAAVAGAVQLLVTSLVSFAMLALGVALWFTATGSPFLTADAALRAGAATSPETSALLLTLAVLVMFVGLGFKLSLVPFHAWTPTAYAGSSTPVALFLATVSKVGALAALLAVLQAVTALGRPAVLAVAIIAALTMTLGNVLALRQDDVVRLLAWSTVAQAGWVVMPLVSVSPAGTRAAAGYLLTYVAATVVAFAVVARTVREVGASGRRMAAYRGLWRRSPWRAGALALALTSLAGLPPGVIGLVGKVVALRPVLAEGMVWLALVAAANAVIGVAIYLRWLRPVISDVDAGEAVAPAPVGRGGHRVAVAATLVVSSVLLLAVSVQPDLLLGLVGG